MHVLYDAEVRLTRICLDVIAMFLRWQVMSGCGYKCVCARACLPTDRLNLYEPIMFRQTKIWTKDTLYAKNNLT